MQINGRILIFWDDFRIKLDQRTNFSFGRGFRKRKGTLPSTCFHFFKSQSHINPLSPKRKILNFYLLYFVFVFLFVVFCICWSNLTRSSLMIPTQPTTHTARFSSSSSTSLCNKNTKTSTNTNTMRCTPIIGARSDHSLPLF